MLALLLGAKPALAQEPEPSSTPRALSAINESSPVGMLSAGERTPGWQGWFGDAWQGTKRIFQAGSTDALLPFFTFHPAYKYPNRFDNNNYPLGIGVARTVIDEKDNERMIYALAFSDSHYDLQPMVGYAWLARWLIGGGFKAGLGYTVLVTARADANYVPFPAIVPLMSLGSDRLNFYGVWVPTTEVLFFFARISLPFKESAPPLRSEAAAGMPPGPGGSPGSRFRTQLVYGALARVDPDASGIDSVAAGHSTAPLAGYRHFVSDTLAVDVSATRSDHSLDLNGARLGTFDLIPVSLTAQFHLPPHRGWRIYAGAGVAYSRITNQAMPGYSLSSGSFSPLLQAGVSYPLTDALVLTGGLSVNFMRHKLSENGKALGTVKLSPVTFSLGLGYAF